MQSNQPPADDQPGSGQQPDDRGTDAGNGEVSIPEIAPPPAGLTAPFSNDEARIDAAYTEQNLQTQQDIANYTGVMALTGIGALLLSCAGVYLIFRTLQETKLAAQSARDTVKSFKDAERAHLRLDGWTGFWTEDDPNMVVVRVGAINGGRTAANLTSVRIGLVGSRPTKNVIEWPLVTVLKLPLESGENTPVRFKVPMTRESTQFIAGYLTYRCRFGDEHRSHFFVEVAPRKPLNALARNHGATHYVHDRLVEDEWPQDT